MPFDITDKIRLLNAGTVKERVFDALKVLHKEMQLLDLKHSIRNKTQEDIDEQQREYFLQQQIKNIKEELGNGENSPERKDLTEKAKKKKWSEETQTIFQKELDRLDTSVATTAKPLPASPALAASMLALRDRRFV